MHVCTCPLLQTSWGIVDFVEYQTEYTASSLFLDAGNPGQDTAEESASQQPAASAMSTPQSADHCCYASCLGLLWSHPIFGPLLEAECTKNTFTSDLDFPIDWAKASPYEPPSPELTSSQLGPSSTITVQPLPSTTETDRPKIKKRRAKKQPDFSNTGKRRARQDQWSAAARGDASNRPSTSAPSALTPQNDLTEDQRPQAQFMNIRYYEVTYNQAKDAMAELNSTRISMRYFPSEITWEEARIILTLLRALGILLSEHPKYVRQALSGSPYGSFFKDGMDDQGETLKGIICELRDKGIALYNPRNLIDNPSLRSWYGDVDREVPDNVSVSNMTGRFSGIHLLRKLIIITAPIFNAQQQY